MIEFLIAGFVLAVVMTPLGAWVATQKRRSAGEGALLGFGLGPFGVLIEALLPTGDARPHSRPRPDRAAIDRRAAAVRRRWAAESDNRVSGFLAEFGEPSDASEEDRVYGYLTDLAGPTPPKRKGGA